MSPKYEPRNQIARCWSRSNRKSSIGSSLFFSRPARSYSTQTDNAKPAGDIIQAILKRNAHIPTKLGTLKPMPGSHKPETRIGRGIGSGKGKTAGRGHKGRTARQGGEVAFGFEGGQTPYYKRVRKYGFTNNYHKISFAPLNLARLQYWIDTGRIDSNQPITIKTLLDTGCVGRLRKNQIGIKLLSDGSDWWKTPINIEVTQASTGAINAIEQTGGKIKLVYYNKLGMRALTKPEKFYPHTERKIPYLTVPRANLNARLNRTMEQPSQLSGYTEQPPSEKQGRRKVVQNAKHVKSESQ